MDRKPRRDTLAIALARHIGETLTPALAVGIAREVCRPQDRSIDPGRFPPQEWQGYTLQAERLMDAGYELRVLRTAFLNEAEPDMPQAIDWDRLREVNRDGRSLIFTARDSSGAMVGVCWLWLSVDVDSGLVTAIDDFTYIEPEHRGSMLYMRLVDYASRGAFKAGARDAHIQFTLTNGVDRMARFLGFKHVAAAFRKTHLGEDFADAPTRRTKERA